MRAIQAVRTGVFYLLFMGQTIILAIVVGLIAILWRRRTAAAWAIAQYWRNSNIALLRWIVGVKTDVAGGEKHSARRLHHRRQTPERLGYLCHPALHDGQPAFIAKRELMDIPLFGQAAKSINTISIDRKLGAEAIPKMLEEAREALGRGCRIVIYPEGTRKLPLADPDYRQGIARMYEALNVPVVPVALNSGLCWGRLSATIWPGTAQARFLPAILPGLSGAEFSARLQQVIETETTRLIAQAVAGGLGRPLGAEFRRGWWRATQAAGV